MLPPEQVLGLVFTFATHSKVRTLKGAAPPFVDAVTIDIQRFPLASTEIEALSSAQPNWLKEENETGES